ncbi:PASTA domain-containing protein [Prevotella scopos JCM 17725]|jgi:PASTA domain protein|uniref:PASTA domain-containing protein n=1 Tax=Prevotella scopos JCM 17725 TaxID=1236518 RepID=A0AAX2F3D5_9BACT|nr:PASTA domain-containing protein [Prevotella scopos]ANR72455.1 penicillin-binding protein [Prevotella scopos JCM 17725]QUB45333.1 PASTA domain-containing protein [Prevotella scopos JCM 17725]SHF80226.1 PASTA domain-containing protein [Prevotella scopos JCM 17725]
MTTKEFFHKFNSTYIWGNILAIVILLAILSIGVRFGLDFYTLHGESIVVPNVIHKQYDEAVDIMDKVGLTIEVTDTGYVKELPADCILEQSPVGGKRIKSTHVVYVTINAASAPSLVIPDIIDNNSLREAQAQLLSMGFKVGEPEYIPGEKDWIYGILVNGKHVNAGDRVPSDAVIVLQVGDGTRQISDTAGLREPEYEEVEVEEKVPKYDEVEEYVEVPVDEDGNEIKDTRGKSGSGSSNPSSQSGLPADPSSVRPKE